MFSPVPNKYTWSHTNRYFLCVEQNQLAFGGGYATNLYKDNGFRGGIGYGLMVDDELHFGTSIRCATFNNEPLNGGKTTFECVAMEIFSFPQ